MNTRRLSHKRPRNDGTTYFYRTDLNRAALLLAGDYLRRYFCRWCRFLLLVCSGRPVFSSSPRRLARLWPDTDWHWSPLRGSHQHQSYTYCEEHKDRSCQHSSHKAEISKCEVCLGCSSMSESALYLRSWPLSSEDTSSICTWSHS